MTLSTVLLNDPNDVRLDDQGRTPAYFCRTLPKRIDLALINELKTESSQRGNTNIRLCLHSSPDADFHSMLILEYQGGFYPPHKHLNKGESFHIIEGRLGVFAFNGEGVIVDAVSLSPDEILIYRIELGMFHCIRPLTEFVIYHESKPGPFLGTADSIIPDWAPNIDDEQKFDEYLLKALDHFK